jgi:cell division protein ZapA
MSLQVTVSILDREYVVGCTEAERAGLIAAASYLDGKMREVRNAARTASVDRIAVLAALNIAHELLRRRKRPRCSTTSAPCARASTRRSRTSPRAESFSLRAGVDRLRRRSTDGNERNARAHRASRGAMLRPGTRSALHDSSSLQLPDPCCSTSG